MVGRGKTMQNARSIYLNKKLKLIIEPGSYEQSDAAVATFASNLDCLGFAVSKSLFNRLKTLSTPQLSDLYNDVVPVLQKMVGAHRKFKPFYPNFPQQVMDTPALELYFNAMVHYWATNSAEKQIIPVLDVKEEREKLQGKYDLKAIDLGSVEDFEKIFTNLVGSNSSISEDDKNIITWFFATYKDLIVPLIPESIPQKEQLAFVLGLALKHIKNPSFLTDKLKTATDILRLTVAMSDGDVSLAEPTKFRSFSRAERRFILKAMNDCKSLTEDMLRWPGRWVRLSHNLHVGEYAGKYPKAAEAIDIIRNKKPFVTYNSRIESIIKSAVFSEDDITLLKSRPGDFARRLDKILRVNPSSAVVEGFRQVAENVSTPVLMQLYQHFQNRLEAPVVRSFFPKGNLAKIKTIQNNLDPLPENLVGYIAGIIRKTLVERFSKLPSLGKVYIDESLKLQFLPAGLRSASKALRTLARGSRVDFNIDSNVLRFFLWWKNAGDRTDIDLSAVAYNDQFNHLFDLSYYNLRNYGACHSGDIVSAPDGACEFIDIDIDKLLKTNVRYIVMNINSFTKQPYCSLPECFAGWMGRKSVRKIEPVSGHYGEVAQDGEIFEPKTVLNKIDIASNTNMCCPMILDLVNRQIIWVDLSLKNNSLYNNVHSNRNKITELLRSMVELKKPNLYDLFSMHAEGRGTLIEDKDKADVVFSLNEGVTPYDYEKVLAQFMT